MPIYSYRCDTCGFEQDLLRKMSDPPLVVCPSCGESTLRKQVTAAGFQLKGSGWYVTDFRNPATKEPAKGVSKGDGEPAPAPTGSDGEPAKAASSPSDAPTPAKPAASTESTGDSKPTKTATPPATGSS